MPKGCKLCLKGEKLVLFMTGKCSRNCPYCSLSNNRKKSRTIYANERPCKSTKDVIKEVIENNAKGAGITGGDPLIDLNTTTRYARALKKKFGKSFHIHIYLPTNLVTENKLKKLSKYIDEVRFHPKFLQEETNSTKTFSQDIEKIKIASKIFKKQNTGLEMPAIPEKKNQIIDFINQALHYIGFVNLNELEISETNFKNFSKKYNVTNNTHSIEGSKKSALEILRKLKQTKIKVHLCTARTKDVYQYNNRLLKHNIFPFGHRQKDGSVIYFAIYEKQNLFLSKIISGIRHLGIKNFYADKPRKRILLSDKILEDILAEDKFRVARVLEHPTYDKTVLEFWEA